MGPLSLRVIGLSGENNCYNTNWNWSFFLPISLIRVITRTFFTRNAHRRERFLYHRTAAQEERIFSPQLCNLFGEFETFFFLLALHTSSEKHNRFPAHLFDSPWAVCYVGARFSHCYCAGSATRVVWVSSASNQMEQKFNLFFFRLMPLLGHLYTWRHGTRH